MFSSTVKYAIRAVLYIAMKQDGDKDKKIGIKQLAKDLDMPAFFLGKILQTLAKHKILKSYKGPNGGFTFNKDPKDISLLEIVEIFDGTDVFNSCLLGLNLCKGDPKMKELCPLAEDIDVCVYNLYNYLKNKNIGDIASSLRSIDEFVMI